MKNNKKQELRNKITDRLFFLRSTPKGYAILNKYQGAYKR